MPLEVTPRVTLVHISSVGERMWNGRQQEGRDGGLGPDGTYGEGLSVFHPLFSENILL